MKPRKELIASLVEALVEERTAAAEARKQEANQVVLDAQRTLRQWLVEVRGSDDLDTTLHAERQILDFANTVENQHDRDRCTRTGRKQVARSGPNVFTCPQNPNTLQKSRG